MKLKLNVDLDYKCMPLVIMIIMTTQVLHGLFVRHIHKPLWIGIRWFFM